MSRRNAGTGPSQTELHLRSELDRARRELTRLKKGAAASGPAEPAPRAAEAEAAPAAVPPGSPGELEALRQQAVELTATRQRLSRLYFGQIEENNRRGRRLHQILESIAQINAGLELDTLLPRIADSVSTALGFRIVLVRICEPGSDVMRARAFVGIGAADRARLEGAAITAGEFRAWLREEFRVSRSYFVPHRHDLDPRLRAGYLPKLGTRQEWEWHEDDVLLVPLHDRGGELVGCLSVCEPADRLAPSTEIVEQLEIFGNHAVVALENARLYREMERQTQQLLESARRLAELQALKSQFVSTISHELRTPLTALRTSLDTLQAAAAGEIAPDRLRHVLGIMDGETQRLARLVDSVLDLNRSDSWELRPERRQVDLAEVVRGALGLLTPAAEAGQVTLKLVGDDADTGLEADPEQLRQLVLHLGGNAVKFTPAGGAVTVLLSGAPEEVVLRVEDTGIGIPEGELERVFERFYQVDSSLVRRFGGAGVGLAVCRSIVEEHGGRITAESVPGRGSVFTATLPRRAGPRVALQLDPSAPSASGDLLRLAIEMVAEVMDARVVSLLAPGPDGVLGVRAAIGLDERVVREARVPPGVGVAGWVAANRRPVCVANSQESSEIAGSGRDRYCTRTFISVPLEGENGLLGVLNVTDPVSGQAFDAQDCELLLHLAERVGAAWSVLLRAAEGDGAAGAMHRMLCHFERDRQGAPGRVRWVRLLARELGLGEAEAATVAFAAGVHDIGMTALPASLRDCAAPFSAEERATMERHAEIGADLLKPFEAVGAVREIVLSHHEWWDGTGYPRALRGEEIPVGARILAVVDAWESMTVGRPHRPARPHSDARRELEQLAGRQFDPRVVEALGRVLDGGGQEAGPGARRETEDASASARR